MDFDTHNNICKDLAWKVPFENYQILSPEFYKEKNLEILYHLITRLVDTILKISTQEV